MIKLQKLMQTYDTMLRILIPKDFDAKTPDIVHKIQHYNKNFYFPRILMQKLQK